MSIPGPAKRRAARAILIASCACALLLGFAAVRRAEAVPGRTMPKALQGVWYQDDVEGRQQCAAYRADPGDENAIVGQLRVRRHDFAQFAEYGEGNRSRVVDVEPLPGKRWRVRNLASSEGEDSGQPGETVFELEQGRLIVSYEEEGAYQPPVTQGVYSKCK